MWHQVPKNRSVMMPAFFCAEIKRDCYDHRSDEFPWLNDVLILQQKHVKFQQVTKIVPAHVFHCLSTTSVLSVVYMQVMNLSVDIAKSGATYLKS